MVTIATKPLTADEFLEFTRLPENHGRYFELDRGEIVEMPPPTHFHGFVCGNIDRILGNYAERRRRGYICTNDSGVILGRTPDTVRGIDVAYYDDLPSAAADQRKYSEIVPQLAVEVMSPHDRLTRMLRRVQEMLDGGVKWVWLVDPIARELSHFRLSQPTVTLVSGDDLDGGDVLTGFRCRVAEFFGSAAE